MCEKTFIWSATGRLKRRYRKGSVELDGYLDDYACLINRLLDLYEAGFDVRLISAAVRMQESQERLFWDPKQGGYYTTTGNDRSVPDISTVDETIAQVKEAQATSIGEQKQR